MARAVLLTGGNLGEVAQMLATARRKLIDRAGVELAASTLYESEPWGFDAPERFLNQVLVLDTPLDPEQLLDCCQQIEIEGGRVRAQSQAQGLEKECGSVVSEKQNAPLRQYCSRSLDIDILFYEDQVIDTPRLQVPHPLLHQRGFVLRPLAEVLPDWIHPVLHKTVRQLLDELKE